MTNRISVLFFAVLAFLPLSSSLADETFYVDYSAQPNPDHLLAYDLSILHPEASADLAPGQKLGNRFLAYVSLIEVAADAPYRAEAEKAGIVFAGKNPVWNSDLADPADPKWRAFVVENLARPAMARGFDGFLLDTVDSLRLLGDSAASREGLAELIRSLKREFPGKSLVMNRGFDLTHEMGKSIVDGVLVESVFQTFDPATREYKAVDPAISRGLQDQIAKVRTLGLPVYVVDYLAPGNAEAATDTAKRIRALGAAPFLSTPELNGTVTGGGQVARRILCLFGHDPKEAESHRIWPADTTTHAIFQMPLEWMGYEVDYHDVSKGLPTIGSGASYAGVILDEEIEIPYRLEHEFADWLLARIDQGKKVLFTGSYGFNSQHERGRIFKRLGIRAGEDLPLPPGMPEIAYVDREIMEFEAKAAATRRDFENIAAPSGARVLLTLQTPESAPVAMRYDTAYLTNWGGALLSPFVVFEASEETILQHANPFAFLGQIWPQGAFPAPDPTTRDGLRVFYTHVDGDGFSSLSAVDPGKTCAEVLRDRFIKDLPWPITISVVEAEIRGQMLSQSAGEAEKLTQIAKDILRLPQVEPASHSYSHPYLWMEDDPEFLGMYDTLNLPLKLTAKYPKIDFTRETVGSLEYLNRELSPAGKPAGLLLWSGNCRPSPEVLRTLRSQGYENMNGGNTILCRRFPGLFGVAPRVCQWDGELQIHAANQNEFLYTDGWNGPTWGGFAQVIETFEMTEAPRRLKPVNVYYHFYSVERPDAFGALKKIYDWCRGQDLHAMTTLQFARVTRDAHTTRLVKTGDDRWTALNDGHLRTFRIPTSLGTPDIAASAGVTGYRNEDEWTYVHTSGAPRVTLQMSQNPAAHPFIEAASAEIAVDRLDPRAVELHVKNQPARLVVGGFAPGAAVELTTTETTSTKQADADGRLAIEAAAASVVKLSIYPKQ
jgi:hypothetical protein